MKVPYCSANQVGIEGWLEDHCRAKNCPHLVYVCPAWIIEQSGGYRECPITNTSAG